MRSSDAMTASELQKPPRSHDVRPVVRKAISRFPVERSVNQLKSCLLGFDRLVFGVTRLRALAIVTILLPAEPVFCISVASRPPCFYALNIFPLSTPSLFPKALASSSPNRPSLGSRRPVHIPAAVLAHSRISTFSCSLRFASAPDAPISLPISLYSLAHIAISFHRCYERTDRGGEQDEYHRTLAPVGVYSLSTWSFQNPRYRSSISFWTSFRRYVY